MTRKERAALILKKLEEVYPDVKCSLDYTTPLEMLIATQLIVTKPLFERYKSVDDFADADYDELCEYIRSAGFYRNKAKNIIACCRRIRDEYDGRVPDTMEDLLTLAGTGRKTANLVLGDVYGKPAIVVDTHCIRLTNRMGLTTNSEPEKIEQDLRKIIPPDKGCHFCHQLVAHGRGVCTARKAHCESCNLNEVCKKVGLDKKKKK